ncbi:MAG TPA: hypothetical protein VF104_01000 [Burkholderiales bacterium]
MTSNGKWLVALATLTAAGCASGPPFIEVAQPEAIQTAQRRAQFEFNCPSVTAQVLSQQNVQSPLEYTRFAPPPRVEYTIGVAGCGQRHTYLVICTEGSGGCFAAAGRPVQ